MKMIMLCLLMLPASLLAQGKKITTLTVSDSIRCAAIDRPGELYVVTHSGQIQRFDKDGKLQQLFKNNQRPTLFDPRDGARLFAYYREQRWYTWMNPSFETVASFRIDSAFALEPWMVCSSGDYNLWIWDAADGSLKKIDTKNGMVLTEQLTVLRNNPPVFMREYQGFLFMQVKEGIRIYNGMGKLVRTLPVTDLRYFNFLGEEIYYTSQGKLKFFNLFTTETRELALKKPATMVLVSDERFYSVQPTAIDIFEYTPN